MLITKKPKRKKMKELRQNLSSFFICQENNGNLLRFHFL